MTTPVGDRIGINARRVPISPRLFRRIPGRQRQWYQALLIPDAEAYWKSLPLSEGHIDARECFHTLIVAGAVISQTFGSWMAS